MKKLNCKICPYRCHNNKPLWLESVMISLLVLFLSACDDGTQRSEQLQPGTESEQLQPGTESEQLQPGTESETGQDSSQDSETRMETDNFCPIDDGLTAGSRNNILMIIENASNPEANGRVLRCSPGSEFTELLQTGNYSGPVRLSCSTEPNCEDPELCQCAIGMEW